MFKQPALVAATMLIAVSGGAQGACTIPGARVPETLAAKVDRDPSYLLLAMPRGGGPMRSVVIALSAASADRAVKLAGLALAANVAQRRSLALGLRYTADICGAKDQEMRQRIEREVQRTNLPAFVQLYKSSDALGLDAADIGTPPAPAVAGRQQSVGVDDPTLMPQVGADMMIDPFSPQDIR